MEHPKIIIALDGHSSCGKSTFAKRIASELEYTYIDTGAMYRAVTLACMEAGLYEQSDSPSEKEVEAVLEGIGLDLKYNHDRERTEIYLNNRMVEDRIRSMDVSGQVSYISAMGPVRRKMVKYQRRLGMNRGVVMDGRDIGTVVFPDAELKIFLTASPEVRAMRRYNELIEKGMEASLEQVKENLDKRDRIDSTRKESPLKQAPDARVLDNSRMTVDQQMVWFRKVYHDTISSIHGED
ncbi:MAG: (d)CMP kinase [Bacteroidota bacterium]